MSESHAAVPLETVEPAAPETSPDTSVEWEISRKTRRSVLVGGIAALAGTVAWSWLRSRRPDDEIAWPLRIALRTNEQLWRDYFSQTRLARIFAPSDIDDPRVNGNIGLEEEPDPAWDLSIEGIAGADEALSLRLDDIKALPKIELVTELKCIEGWSRVLKWGGARFRDFVIKYAPGQADPNGYVAFETPDREYYIGLDMASAFHPQTLLWRPARPIIGPSGATITTQDFRNTNPRRIQNEEDCCIMFRGGVDDAVAGFRSGQDGQGQDA